MDLIASRETLNRDLKKSAENFTSTAIGMTVDSQAKYEIAAEFLKGLRSLRAKIDASYDPIIHTTHLAHKAATAAKREQTNEADKAEKVIRPKIAHYLDAMQRERIRLQRVADEAAQKQADEDAIEEAEHLEKMGDSAGAEAVLDAPVVALPVAVPPTVQKVEGIHLRETWHYRVEDLKALVVAVAKGKVPIQALQVNAAYLNVHAGRNKVSLPGVRVWRDDSVVAGKGGDK